MAWIGTYVYNTLFVGATDSEGYKPSVFDVVTVKDALHKKSSLPYELVDYIVDLAEYWPHTTTITTQATTVTKSITEDLRILRSYPIGYIPSNIDHALPADDIAIINPTAYQSLTPEPIRGNIFPQEVTGEVLSCWRAKSVPKGEHPCRKIVFTIKSHDQGWGGQANQKGTYEGSYTWFEAGLEKMTAYRDSDSRSDLLDTVLPNIIQGRNPAALEPRPDRHFDVFPIPQSQLKTGNHQFELCERRNVVALAETKEHKITWSYNDNVIPDSLEAIELGKRGRGQDSANGEFVRRLEAGDVVTVWGKARFPGWVNHVDEIKMDIFWVV